MSDPYSMESSALDLKFRLYQEWAVRDPRALALIPKVTSGYRRPLLVVSDPARRWARSWREFWRQLRDVVVHEFWMAQGRPERSPGARYVQQADVGAGSAHRQGMAVDP